MVLAVATAPRTEQERAASPTLRRSNTGVAVGSKKGGTGVTVAEPHWADELLIPLAAGTARPLRRLAECGPLVAPQLGSQVSFGRIWQDPAGDGLLHSRRRRARAARVATMGCGAAVSAGQR